MKMLRWYKIFCLISTLLAATSAQAASKPATSEEAPKPVSVIFQTSFIPTIQYAPFYVAQEVTWSKLNVQGKALPGKGTAFAIQTVSAGSAQLGNADWFEVINAIQQGAPVTIISNFHQKDASGVYYLRKSGIQGLKDLRGKKLGIYPFGTGAPMAKAALQKEGIPLESINFVNTTPPGDFLLVREEKVDAQVGYAGSQAIWLKCQGVDAADFPLAQWFGSYGMAIFANNAWLAATPPETVGRVLAGIFQGMTFVKRNFEEGFKIMARTNPDSKVERFRELGWGPFQHEVLLPSPDVEKNGFGWIDPAKVERTQNQLIQLGLLKQKADLANVYTTKYLQDQRVKEAAMEYARTPVARMPDDVKKTCGM